MEDNDLHFRLDVEDALFLKRIFTIVFYVLDDDDPYFKKASNFLGVIDKYLKEVKK